MVSLKSLNDHSVSPAHPNSTSSVSKSESKSDRTLTERPSVPEAAIAPISSRHSSWLTPLAYRLGRFVLPFYFRRIQISGQENLPKTGAIILAPTHRARWDALLIPYAAGRCVTGRDIHFMVTADEVKGLQGWFIRRLGGFAVNPRQPTIASLRHGVEVLQNQEMMVIFPEGGIFRDNELHPLKPGLARLALQAESMTPGLGVKIVPIHLQYGQPIPRWGCGVNIRIGKPIAVSYSSDGSAKQRAQELTAALTQGLGRLVDDARADSSPQLSEGA